MRPTQANLFPASRSPIIAPTQTGPLLPPTRRCLLGSEQVGSSQLPCLLLASTLTKVVLMVGMVALGPRLSFVGILALF